MDMVIANQVRKTTPPPFTASFVVFSVLYHQAGMPVISTSCNITKQNKERDETKRNYFWTQELARFVLACSNQSFLCIAADRSQERRTDEPANTSTYPVLGSRKSSSTYIVYTQQEGNSLHPHYTHTHTHIDA